MKYINDNYNISTCISQYDNVYTLKKTKSSSVKDLKLENETSYYLKKNSNINSKQII